MANKKKSKTGRGWIWVLAIVIFLGVALSLSWHLFKKDLSNPKSKIVKPLLTNELKKMISEASDGLYHIGYSKFNLDINSGNGLITGFKLIPDTNVLKQLIAKHAAPNNVMNMTVDSLVLKDFGFVTTKNGKRFNVGSINMYHPVIRIINKLRLNNEPAKKSSLFIKAVKSILKAIDIQTMVVKNMTFTYINENEKIVKHTSLKNLDVYLLGFAADSSLTYPGNAKSNRDNRTPGLQIKVCRISTPDSLYHINLDSIQFLPERHDLLIGKVAIVPRLSVPEFYKTVRYNKDRFNMVFNHMRMTHIDVEEFLKKQQIHIGHISVASSWSEVYNNYRWPKHIPPIRRHGYSQERLQRLAFDITIDTMTMHKGIISYKIAAEKSGKVADFFMTHTESSYYNITNNTAAKSKQAYSTAFMRTRIMDAADFMANFKFDLKSKNGDFTYTFSMGKMDGEALNPLAEPLALVNIASANIDTMHMEVKANEQEATGNVDMYYDHMKIALLKPDKDTDTLKKKKLLSLFANTLLPDDNPKKNGKFRKGPINVTRDPRMSFLGFMYKGMLDGMTSSILGTNQHKDQADKNIVTKLGRKFVKPPKTSKGSH